MTNTNPISVQLGEMQESVEARVRSGDYASAEEVVQEGLRALGREEAAFEAELRIKVQEALDSNAPTLSHEEVFANVRAHLEERLKAAKSGA